jgi:hypothetical protein
LVKDTTVKILRKDNVSIDEMIELTKDTLRTLDAEGYRATLKTLAKYKNVTDSFAGETILQTRNPESKEVKDKLPLEDLALYKQLLPAIIFTKKIDKRELLELLNVPEIPKDNRAFALIRALNGIEAFGAKYGIPLIRWKIYVAKFNTNGTFSYNEMSWGY